MPDSLWGRHPVSGLNVGTGRYEPTEASPSDTNQTNAPAEPADDPIGAG